MKKVKVFLIILCMAGFLLRPGKASADYRYNEFDETVPAQSCFTAERSVNGRQLDIGAFHNLMDLYVAEEKGLIYLLDAGNNRVVILNARYAVHGVIEPEENIAGAKGIYVDRSGLIYLADGPNGRVIAINEAGEKVREITKPESVLLTENITFIPRNVLMDQNGTLYIISENSTQGAYMIGENGEFLGFYGRNEIDVTADVLFQAMLRSFVSEAQRARMENFIPVEFANFDMDEEGFIYTVTGYAENPKNYAMIKKLNPLGKTVISGYRDWGDEPDGEKYRTSYTDIAVDRNGFIYALDSYSGRIFLFDPDGYQAAIFGGKSNQKGWFSSPAAIDTLGNRVLAVDSQKENLTVFEATGFGELLVKAMALSAGGKLQEAAPYYEKLTAMDANFYYGYLELAEAGYEKGDYKTALAYAKLAPSLSDVYSMAKKELRNSWMREHFSLLFFGVLILFIVVSVKCGRRRRER